MESYFECVFSVIFLVYLMYEYAKDIAIEAFFALFLFTVHWWPNPLEAWNNVKPEQEEEKK